MGKNNKCIKQTTQTQETKSLRIWARANTQPRLQKHFLEIELHQMV